MTDKQSAAEYNQTPPLNQPIINIKCLGRRKISLDCDTRGDVSRGDRHTGDIQPDGVPQDRNGFN